MKISNTATFAAVILQLMTLSTIVPIRALSQTLSAKSVTEHHYTPCDDDDDDDDEDDEDEDDDDFESGPDVQDEATEHIQKIFASLLVTDHTANTFDWDSVSKVKSFASYTVNNQTVINETNITYKEQLSNALVEILFGPYVKFLYWNSVLGNEKSIEISWNNLNEMVKNWLPGKPLKVITHGYLVSQKHDQGVFSIKKAYIEVGGYNVITVDWSKRSKTILYPIAAWYTKRVGEETAKLLEHIVQTNVIKPCDIHFIGHSLGAHVAGACGDSFQPGKIGRITGLDPAGPLFQGWLFHFRPLGSKDAEFVDVIHTDMGLYGIHRSVGSVDFYPNGGYDMPGCLFRLFHVCRHLRSFKYYTESVYNNNSFVSTKCGSWKNYKNGACKNNEKNHMGHNADPKMSGDFYLATFPSSPYSMDPI